MYFFKLIRTGNLLLLIFLLLIFRFKLLIPLLNTELIATPESHLNFILLTIATVLIAAGGYAINDYYDKNIDKINKPDKLIAGKKIAVRRVLLIHFNLTTLGIFAGCLLSYFLRSYLVLFVFLLIPALLWYYSAKLKKLLLTGNLLIALLSALPLLLLLITEIETANNDLLSTINTNLAWLWMGIYAIFIFLLMLAREVVKDMEDVSGDAAFNRRTIATEYGVKKASILAICIIFSLLLTMMVVFCINYHIFMPEFIVYIFSTLIIPLIISIILLIRGKNKKDFHVISGVLKAVMLAGILSPAILNL